MKNYFKKSFILKNKIKLFRFSTKDDKFWEEYSRRKTEQGKLPALKEQEFVLNKVIHSWKFSSNHSLTNKELFEAIGNLNKGDENPFIILDVREDVEIEMFKMPKYTKVLNFKIERSSSSHNI